MRKSWLLCVLLVGTMAWGQMQPTPPPGSAQAPSGGTPSAAGSAPAAEVPEDAVVLTIFGVCTPSAKTTAAGKTATGKSATAKKPADCKTTITRAEFEKIAKGLSPSPNVTPQLKRQLATALPKFMAMSEAAKAKGLDQSEAYKETLRIAKMQILTTQLQRSAQEEADKVSPQEIETYYKTNATAYDQYSLDRLFVPRFKQQTPDKPEEEEKLTDEQKKAKEAEDKAKQEQGEQELTKLADTLRQRAAAGEDFMKLQKEAFEAANMKMDSPTVSLPKVRRTGLPPAHAAVFELKVGEISAVITDNGGHYIYKVVSKETLPLDQVREEIHNTLKSQHMKDVMDKYNNSYHAEQNEAYFGPPGPAGPMGGRPLPQRMPRPNPTPQGQPQTAPQTTPPAANPPAQPPAQPAPSSNPN